MTQHELLFLDALRASLQGEPVCWEQKLSARDWEALFSLADAQHVLPMIYEAVYRCPSAGTADPAQMSGIKQQVIRSVMAQTMRTHELFRLLQHLRQADVTPLVVKGIICRSLYPAPDSRMSGDEDIFLPPEQFPRCHEALRSFGMQPADPAQDPSAEHEVTYQKPNSMLRIELHKSLFPPDSDAYGDLNRFFACAHAQAISISLDGISIPTMSHTDHFFYLICHAFKHFLHSGFGIRQVCDIVMYANQYGSQIDWPQVVRNCQAIRADRFTAALLHIGETYLVFDPKKACCPPEWYSMQVDEIPMLEDLLSGGVYGSSSMSRLHSSNITLNAVSAQKRGEKAGSSHVLKTVFPSAKKLEGRYPYLKKHAFLLPVAWADRIWKYRKETHNSTGNNAGESIQIGSQRIELMRKYGILE
ncbi:MAG TPA: hypothetical protein DDX51_05695 [Clostridiales bacterium]|nr:hypothetical protein [Clostridiales bacterium]